MSNKPSMTSADPAADPQDDFVLDFLYHDSRRIGSFLSQFEGEGHLQQLVRTKAGTRGKREASSQDLKGNVGFASGSTREDTEVTVSANENLARTFDPYWLNARTFLDFVDSRQLLERDLDHAQIGQFVVAKGWLSVLDLAMLKDAWKLPSIVKKVQAGNAPIKPFSQMNATEKAEFKEQKENTDLMLEMMQILPHSVHASLLTSTGQAKMIWCSLREEYLVVPASDLTLAYGGTMPGEWSILGILSALPEFVTPDLDNSQPMGDPGVFQSLIGQVSKALAPVVRVAMGRPAASSAITPLLIFREVSQQRVDEPSD